MASGVVFDSYYGQGDRWVIEVFEQAAGIQLPQEYKAIVSEFNGAFIVNKNAFRFYSRLMGEDVVRSAGMFLPYGQIEDGSETMEIKRQYPPDGFPEGLILFSALGNGDALCFDFREKPKATPPVVVWHHEGAPARISEVSFVAESFADFLGMLFEEKDSSHG